jgi:hypothetical protein
VIKDGQHYTFCPVHELQLKALKILPNEEKDKRSPSQPLFSVLAFLCLKRCNLAAFKHN